MLTKKTRNIQLAEHITKEDVEEVEERNTLQNSPEELLEYPFSNFIWCFFILFHIQLERI